jgi:hypothetical protein
LVHADKHGFLVVPEEDEAPLLEAARFMDSNECHTLISTARESAGLPLDEVLARIEAASRKFGENVKEKLKKRGEY